MKSLRQGLYFAAAASASWALLLVVTRWLLVEHALNPWIFSLIQLVAGGITLMVLGKRPTVNPVLRHPYTWAIGILRILSACLFAFTLTLTSATQATLILRVDTLFAVILGWLFLGRRPFPQTFPGLLTIALGVSLLVIVQPGRLPSPSLGLIFATAFCIATMTLITERHPHNQDQSLRERCWFTGMVLIVIGICYAMGLTVLSAGKHFFMALNPSPIAQALQSLPHWAEFFEPRVWLSGVVVGVLLRTTAFFCQLYAVYLLKAETYMMVEALIPVMVFAIEGIWGVLGLLALPQFASHELLCGGMIIIGSLWGALASVRRPAP